MKSAFYLAALGCTALAVPAHAQDPARTSKVSVGAIAGIDSITLKEPTLGSGSDENIVYGLSLAYDHGFNDVFVGIEGEITESEVGTSETGVFDAGDRIGLNAARDLYVGARLGVYLGDTLSLYVKGGYTNAGVEAEYDDGADDYSETVYLDGFRVGGGMEAELSANFAVRVEYRYSDYGKFSYLGYDTDLTTERHQGVVGLLARF